MVEYLQQNIWEITAQARVIPVNCVGVPGAGLAWQWQQRADPREVSYYKTICANGELLPADCVVFDDSGHILVATKNHFRNPSQLNWIATICSELALLVGDYSTIAVPKLGCGLGKLNWEKEVMPLFDKHFTRSVIQFKVAL